MSLVRVGSRSFEAAAFVFDKDGLMFESQGFWTALGEQRLRCMVPRTGLAFARHWADCFGVKLDENDAVCYTDPKGILAVAAPAEEVAATAALLVESTRVRWDEARQTAAAIFAQADETLELRRALKPRPGFPAILQRLREKGVPYAVATSDTAERVRESLTLYDEPESLAFCITSRDVPCGKPAPDMLLEAAKRFGLSPAQLIMVGDSYVDMEMAGKAGSVGIGVPETEEMRRTMETLGAVIADDLSQIEIL